MSLEKASIVWSAKQLSGMVKSGKINFNHIVQRSYVWERSRKSALIESMILGYPIPPVFAKRVENVESGKQGNNIYYVMDGKQRLSTVKEFLNDEFALTELPPVTYRDEDADCEQTLDITGKKFSELPEALKNYLQTVTFNITYFDHLTIMEERELFKRLNAGKPLSAKSRLLASCTDIERMLNIGEHELFTDMLTAKAIDNKNQATIVMKAWCMLNQPIEEVSFESRIFNPLIEQTNISEENRDVLNKVFDYVYNVHMILKDRKEKKVAKKLYTETHLISLIPYFKKAITEGITEEMIADWLINFYGTTETASISVEYNETCAGGSAKNVNIIDRDEALSKNYKAFFTVDTTDDVEE